MSSNYYSMLFRMKHIKRWALMYNIKSENLSEHSLETAFIAHGLAVIQNRFFKGNLNPAEIALCAMFHDTAEVITGDLPTPVKYYNENIKSAYKNIEAAAEEKLIGMLPEALREDFLKLYHTDDITESFVKAADKISALIKCREELALGNKEFLAAEKATKASIKKLNMPAADLFVKEFLPAFMQGLDENLE